MEIRIWFKYYHTSSRGLMFDGEELLYRLAKLWWRLWIDKHWPNILLKNLSWWMRVCRRMAVRGHLFLLNSPVLERLCWKMDHP